MNKTGLRVALPLFLALCCLAPVLALSGLGSAFVAWVAGGDARTSLWVVAATVVGAGLVAWGLRKSGRSAPVIGTAARPRLRRVLASIALLLILAALLVPLVFLIFM